MLARILTSLAALLALATPASAQDGRWWRGETTNFIVYGDRDDRQVRAAAQALEDFDSVLRTLTRARLDPPETKLEVYLLRGESGIDAVFLGSSENVAGFYSANSEQIAAFARTDNRTGLDRLTILFHEYTHHFMLHYFPEAYPRWYVEGFAEWVSTTEFRDRRAIVGTPSEVRASFLADGFPPITHLLAPERVPRRDAEFTSRFYAHAWFAAMYLANNSERRAGLQPYVAALGAGADPIDAFQPAFGVTPEDFSRELRQFRYQRVPTFSVPLPASPATVQVTRLPRAADDLLLPLARLRMATGRTTTLDVSSAQRAAESHAGDPMAGVILTRIALLQNDTALARQRAEAALAMDENNYEARYLLAIALLRQAADNQDQTALAEARRELVRVFRQEPAHFPTLHAYAATFSYAGVPMEQQHLDVLGRALELAPQASSIRLLMARELIKAEIYENAAIALRPLIYAPHGGETAVRARVLFDAAQARRQVASGAEAAAVEAAAAEE